MDHQSCDISPGQRQVCKAKCDIRLDLLCWYTVIETCIGMGILQDSTQEIITIKSDAWEAGIVQQSKNHISCGGSGNLRLLNGISHQKNSCPYCWLWWYGEAVVRKVAPLPLQ